MGDQPVAKPLPTHRRAWTRNKHTRTFMPWVGFEPTIPVFELPKTVHASDRAATVHDLYYKGKNGEVVPELNYLNTVPWRFIGEWRYSSTIIDIDTRMGEMSASRSGRFTPEETAIRYPLDRRLCGPQIRVGRCGEDKNVAPDGFRTQAVQSLICIQCMHVV
jgi:hypothetical protein